MILLRVQLRLLIMAWVAIFPVVPLVPCITRTQVCSSARTQLCLPLLVTQLLWCSLRDLVELRANAAAELSFCLLPCAQAQRNCLDAFDASVASEALEQAACMRRSYCAGDNSAFAKFVMFTNAAWAMVGGLFIIETLLLACNSFR